MQTIKIEVNGVDLLKLVNQIEEITTTLKTQSTPAPNKENAELLTRSEVCAILGVTLPTVHEWTKRRILKSYRIGNRIRYKRGEIMEALKSRD